MVTGALCTGERKGCAASFNIHCGTHPYVMFCVTMTNVCRLYNNIIHMCGALVFYIRCSCCSKLFYDQTFYRNRKFIVIYRCFSLRLLLDVAMALILFVAEWKIRPVFNKAAYDSIRTIESGDIHNRSSSIPIA